MTQGDPENGGNGGDNELENDGKSTPTPKGNDDWKAKYEEQLSINKSLTQNRNHFRKLSEDQAKSIEDLTKKVEGTQAEFDQFKQETDQNARKQAAKDKSSEILNSYEDPSVKDLANELGIELEDADDDEAINRFKAKLDKIKDKVESKGKPEDVTPPRKQPRVDPNNPTRENTETPPKTEDQEMSELETRLADFKF